MKRIRNKEKTRQYDRNRYAKRRANSEYLEYQAKYQEEHREKIYAQNHQWYLDNKQIRVAISKAYRIRKFQQIPEWANMNAIKDIYKNCPSGFHVDHIIPLKGKTVCGLHIETNLQYLPANENLAKGNKFEDQ